MPTDTALRIARVGLDPLIPRYEQKTDEGFDPLALDPLAFIGQLKVPDLETHRPVPFRLYDHQAELVVAHVDLSELTADAFIMDARPRFRNLFVEKSRQMGDTWLFAAVDLWAISYWPVAGLVTHLKQKKVDDGGRGATPESYFGKVQYLWKSLPQEERAPLDFIHLLIRNRTHPGRLIGEAANSDPGRGGTYDKVTVDEAARMPYGEKAQTALIEACPDGRVYLSTPYGEDAVFYRIKKRQPASFSFHRHHWSRHPVKGAGLHTAGEEPATCSLCAGNDAGVLWTPDHPERAHRYPGKVTSPWYDGAVVEYDEDVDVAQELDIDYTASQPGRVFPEFHEPTHVWTPEQIRDRFGRETLFDPYLPPETCWDYGADTNAVVILQDLPDSLRVCGEYEIGDSLPEDVAAGVIDVLADLGVPIKHLIPSWTRRYFAVGDPAGEGRQQGTGRPLIDDYRRAGFSIQSRPTISVDMTIRSVKRLLRGRPKPIIVDGARAPGFVEHAKKNMWPVDSNGRRKLNASAPLNNEHNHMMRAFAYYAHFKYPPPARRNDRPDPGYDVDLPSARLPDAIRYGENI